jgi:hypothetical protein
MSDQKDCRLALAWHGPNAWHWHGKALICERTAWLLTVQSQHYMATISRASVYYRPGKISLSILIQCHLQIPQQRRPGNVASKLATARDAS